MSDQRIHSKDQPFYRATATENLRRDNEEGNGEHRCFIQRAEHNAAGNGENRVRYIDIGCARRRQGKPNRYTDDCQYREYAHKDQRRGSDIH